MNCFLPLIILVILGCIYAGSLKTAQNRLWTVICMLIFILFICYLQLHNSERFSNYSGYAPIDYTLKNKRNTCDGLNYNTINKQISSTGTYDGIKFRSNIVTKPLVNPVTIFSPVGDGITLTEPLGNKNYPSVDGMPDSSKHLFTFANNTVSPECCGHSNISSDMGCVCYSPEQLKMFGYRGNNVSEPNSYPEL